MADGERSAMAVPRPRGRPCAERAAATAPVAAGARRLRIRTSDVGRHHPGSWSRSTMAVTIREVGRPGDLGSPRSTAYARPAACSDSSPGTRHPAGPATLRILLVTPARGSAWVPRSSRRASTSPGRGYARWRDQQRAGAARRLYEAAGFGSSRGAPPLRARPDRPDLGGRAASRVRRPATEGSPVRNELTVVVLAAGGGTRMKSKTMKVLHPVCGRSMIGHVLTAVQAVRPAADRRGGRPPARAGRRRTSPRWSPAPCSPSRRPRRAPGDAVRVAMEAAPARRAAPCSSRTATPRCSRARACARSPRSTRRPQRAVSILSGVVAEPVRLRPGGPQRRGRRRGDRGGEGRHARAARHPRDQLRDPRVRRRVPRRGAAEALQRQRQGRVLPDRHGPDRPRRRASPSAPTSSTT